MDKYLQYLEPITIDNLPNLKPGQWIWDNKPVVRGIHKRTLSDETITEPYGFRQIHIVDAEDIKTSRLVFSLTNTVSGGYKWEYFENGRYYKFKS